MTACYTVFHVLFCECVYIWTTRSERGMSGTDTDIFRLRYCYIVVGFSSPSLRSISTPLIGYSSSCKTTFGADRVT